MKVEVEIPEGKYCNKCLFFDSEYGICIYIKHRVQDLGNMVKKHPDCPSLNKTTHKLIPISPTEYECTNCKETIKGDVVFMRYCYRCGAEVVK